ncbi:hypothetical protein, partial [Cellulomonas algicola]
MTTTTTVTTLAARPSRASSPTGLPGAGDAFARTLDDVRVGADVARPERATDRADPAAPADPTDAAVTGGASRPAEADATGQG